MLVEATGTLGEGGLFSRFLFGGDSRLLVCLACEPGRLWRRVFAVQNVFHSNDEACYQRRCREILVVSRKGKRR